MNRFNVAKQIILYIYNLCTFIFVAAFNRSTVTAADVIEHSRRYFGLIVKEFKFHKTFNLNYHKRLHNFCNIKATWHHQLYHRPDFLTRTLSVTHCRRHTSYLHLPFLSNFCRILDLCVLLLFDIHHINSLGMVDLYWLRQTQR